MNARRGGGYDDGNAPWLETVDEDYSEGPSLWRYLIALLAVLAAVGIALAAWHWWQRQPSLVGDGSGELIAAPPGDYKIKPDDPGGMKVEGEGDTAFSTSEGALINGTLDLDAAPEEPVVRATPTPPPQPGATLAATVPAQPATPVEAGGATVQLGAFPSEASANAAWERLSKRFAYVAPLGKSVMKAEVNDKTVYRLRVTAGTHEMAKDVCGRLKLAGESCFVAN